MDRKTLISSPRLEVRELTSNDWQEVYSYTGDEAISRFQTWAPHTEQDAQNWVNQAVEAQKKVPRQSYYWGICLKENKNLIGGIGLDLLPSENANSAEIGYALQKQHWRKGFGSEAVSAALSYIFKSTEIRRIVAHCRDTNPASIQLLEKLKFRREAHMLQDVQVRGELMSSYWYALLRDDYLKLNHP